MATSARARTVTLISRKLTLTETFAQRSTLMSPTDLSTANEANKERSAHDGEHDSHLQLGGLNNNSADHIRPEGQSGTNCGRVRKNASVVGAGPTTHDMRSHKADKCDGASAGNCGAPKECD